MADSGIAPTYALSGAATTETQSWRTDLLTTMLRVVLVLGTITAVPSVILSFQVGLPLVGALDLLAVAWVAVIALRTKLSYHLRAVSLLCLTFGLGVAFLTTIGTTSQIYLMATPVLTVLLFGLRPALAALVLTSLTLFGIGYMVDARLSIPGLEALPVVEWLVIALNFAFVASIITIFCGLLLSRLERSTAHASRLTQAVEQARVGIVIGDETGRAAYANATFAAMTGLAIDDLSRALLADVPLRTADGADLIDAIELAGDRQARIVLTRIDEPGVQLEAWASPPADGARHVRDRVIVLRDVTTERQLEARVRQSERLEALGTLAGGVAHDFNNIIGSITAVAEASREETSDERMRADLDRIVVASDRARAIVARMLAFSRHAESERRPILVKTIVDETVPLLRAALPASIDLRVAAAVDTLVVADPSELNQVLMNLATNAAHAMAPKGGGTLSIDVGTFMPDSAFATLHPAVRPDVPYVRLSVTDTGGGIEPGLLERIFEPFFTTKPGHEGTGLGLATVHGTVTSLGGAIDVYSEVGHGATFRIYLPRSESATPVTSPPEPSTVPGGTGHILLVDDEEAIRTMTERMLARLGYRVTTAGDGQEAHRSFADDPTAFDLVLADLTMPKMGGAALIRAIHDLRPDLPAILTSGFSDSMAPDERATLDLASFLHKPYTRAELASQVHRALRDRSPEPGGSSQPGG